MLQSYSPAGVRSLAISRRGGGNRERLVLRAANFPNRAAHSLPSNRKGKVSATNFRPPDNDAGSSRPMRSSGRARRAPDLLNENSSGPGISATRLVQTSTNTDVALVSIKLHSRRSGCRGRSECADPASVAGRMAIATPDDVREHAIQATGILKTVRSVGTPVRPAESLRPIYLCPSPRIDAFATALPPRTIQAPCGGARVRDMHLNMLRAVGISFERRRTAIMELFRARLAERPLTCPERRRPVIEKPLDVKNLLLSLAHYLNPPYAASHNDIVRCSADCKT